MCSPGRARIGGCKEFGPERGPSGFHQRQEGGKGLGAQEASIASARARSAGVLTLKKASASGKRTSTRPFASAQAPSRRAPRARSARSVARRRTGQSAGGRMLLGPAPAGRGGDREAHRPGGVAQPGDEVARQERRVDGRGDERVGAERRRPVEAGEQPRERPGARRLAVGERPEGRRRRTGRVAVGAERQPADLRRQPLDDVGEERPSGELAAAPCRRRPCAARGRRRG